MILVVIFWLLKAFYVNNILKKRLNLYPFTSDAVFAYFEWL